MVPESGCGYFFCIRLLYGGRTTLCPAINLKHLPGSRFGEASEFQNPERF
jgi:hypothetical protein